MIILNPGLINLLNFPNYSIIPATISYIFYQWQWGVHRYSNIYNNIMQMGMHNRYIHFHNKYYNPIQMFYHDSGFANIVANIFMAISYLILEISNQILVILKMIVCFLSLIHRLLFEVILFVFTLL